MEKFLLVFVVLFSTEAVRQPVDQTTDPGASGSNVVRAVVSRLDAAEVFEESGNADLTNVFMRNMAYVETRDGTAYPDDNKNGGIWKLSRNKFQQTQQLDSDFPRVFDAVRREFGIEWQSLDYGELEKPLYSGLAVRLYLTYIAGFIPPTIRHATFWINNFRERASLHDWFTAIEMLSETEVCSIYTDVVFVLDSSGSIGDDNYTKVLNYTRDFVNVLLEDTYRKNTDDTMGSRVGIVLFSNYGENYLLLNESQDLDKNSLVEMIEDIPYRRQWTNTADGLCRALEQPWRDSLTVLRLVVTLTDGKSNRLSNHCGNTTTASQLVHTYNPKLVSYVIGVANFDVEELLAIASAPELIDHLDSFNTDLLIAAQEARTYQICFTIDQPIDVGEPQEGTLERGGSVRLSLQAPAEEGITVRLCVHRGKIVLYASTTIPNPSVAHHDWVDIVTAPENQRSITCHTSFYDLNKPDLNRVPRGKRQTEETIVTLYISIEGQESLNEFQLNSTYGGVEQENAMNTHSGFVVPVVISVTVVSVSIILLALVLVLVIATIVKAKKIPVNKKVMPL